jgi:S1-C subfamily serine protease
MRHLYARLLIALAACAAGWQDYPQIPRQAIVKVLQTHEQGTGVLISSDGWILTVAHAAAFDPSVMQVELGDKRQRVSRVYFSNAHCFDLALIKIDVAGAPFLGIERASPGVGETVFSFGFPRGAAKWSSGFILKYVGGDRQTGFVVTSFVCDRGASGSPMINLRGQICGVLTTGAFDERNQPITNHWISARQIQQLLQDARDSGELVEEAIGR